MAFILDSLAVLADTMKTEVWNQAAGKAVLSVEPLELSLSLSFQQPFGLLVIFGIALPYPGHICATQTCHCLMIFPLCLMSKVSSSKKPPAIS